MRQTELLKGVDVYDADKNRVGCSKVTLMNPKIIFILLIIKIQFKIIGCL